MIVIRQKEYSKKKIDDTELLNIAKINISECRKDDVGDKVGEALSHKDLDKEGVKYSKRKRIISKAKKELNNATEKKPSEPIN